MYSNYAPHAHISLCSSSSSSSYYSGLLIIPCLWMDASTTTHTHRNDNTLLRSCLYTHWRPRPGLEHRMSKPSHKTTYFQTACQSISTTLNFYHLNYPSFKIPFLSSHTFLSPPPPLIHCSSISVQPSYYLITLKVSQKPGFGPKVLNRGHNLADKDCGMFGSVFPGLLYTEWLKREPGGCSSVQRGDICEGLLDYSERS